MKIVHCQVILPFDFHLEFMFWPLIGNYKWQMILPLPWKYCMALCLETINDNCFIFSVHVKLAWDFHTVIQIMTFDFEILFIVFVQPHWGVGRGGVLHQIFGTWVQHAKKTWTQSDIRFCENEGSNRFKINEKGGHLDRKYRRKFIQNA